MSLRERRDILTLAQGATEGVLVTLVRAAGSSYRQPGARLLALPDGHTAGTISGGCLEADLLRKAQWRVRDGAVTHSYDTGFEDDGEVPFGLGCGGIVDLLLEPLDAAETHAALHAIRASIAGHHRSIVTQLPAHPQGFARIVLDAAGDVLFATGSLETDRIVDLRAAARNPHSRIDRAHLFVEHLLPAQRLLLCGAGEDARPVARLAAQLGWSVFIADGRPQHATTERFPEAEQVYVTQTLAPLAPQQADAVVLMTHSFEQDRRFLQELVALAPARRPRYIGLLGARHRSALLLQRAAEAAGRTLNEALAAVHAPVGLDIGGEGPESIALAILAEMQAVLSGRTMAIQRGMSLAEAEHALQRFAARPPVISQCVLDVEVSSR